VVEKLIKHKKYKPSRIILDVVVLVGAIMSLFPIYWMFVGSLMPDSVVISLPPKLFPSSLYFNNYKELFYSAPTLRWLFNSIFISGMTAFFICLISTMAGYAFAKKIFFARNQIFYILVLTMLIPRQILMIPLFRLCNSFGIVDTVAGLILPSLGFPLGVFLMRQFMVTLPSEVFEAATIDGCSEIKRFIYIAVPLAKPGIGALAIYTFMRIWNDYLWQLIIISSTKLKTLPLGIAGFKQEYSARHGLLLAGAVLASIPMIIVFFMFQKYFTKGLTAGAVKG
jgi:multiple sugar transport system permease protein